jgi:hypothetical protein
MNLVMLGEDYVSPLYLSADAAPATVAPTGTAGWITQGLSWTKDLLGIVNSATGKVTPPVVSTPPSFMDQYGTSVLIGGGALLVVLVLMSGKRSKR